MARRTRARGPAFPGGKGSGYTAGIGGRRAAHVATRMGASRVRTFTKRAVARSMRRNDITFLLTPTERTVHLIHSMMDLKNKAVAQGFLGKLVVPMLENMGALAATRIRAVLRSPAGRKPIELTSVAWRISNIGSSLRDTGNLERVISFDRRLSGNNRWQIEVGPLGTTVLSEKYMLDTIPANTHPEKFPKDSKEATGSETLSEGTHQAPYTESAQKVGTQGIQSIMKARNRQQSGAGRKTHSDLTYRQLAWLHEHGWISPVTPKMLGWFRFLSVTGDAHVRSAAKAMLRNLGAFEKSVGADGKTKMSPASVSGKYIDVPARPFMSVGMRQAYKIMRRGLGKQLAYSLFPGWIDRGRRKGLKQQRRTVNLRMGRDPRSLAVTPKLEKLAGLRVKGGVLV